MGDFFKNLEPSMYLKIAAQIRSFLPNSSEFGQITGKNLKFQDMVPKYSYIQY